MQSSFQSEQLNRLSSFSMASFEKFDESCYAVDGTKSTITKTGGGWRTAYGRTSMLCDGAHRGVYEFHVKVVEMAGYIVMGIDEGRTNMKTCFHSSSTYHYALGGSGKLYEKGTYRTASICGVCGVVHRISFN